MKHTSIRLSEEHTSKIKETGESPTSVIKKALDSYFGVPAESTEAKKLMDEHLVLYHRAQSKHIASTKDKHDSEHIASTDIRVVLEYILGELAEGREPLLPDIAAGFGLSTQALAKSLSPHGIRTKETKRAGVPGRYFTLDMKDSIQKIVKI